MAVSNGLKTKSVRERVGEREWQATSAILAASTPAHSEGWLTEVRNVAWRHA